MRVEVEGECARVKSECVCGTDVKDKRRRSPRGRGEGHFGNISFALRDFILRQKK